MSKLNSEKLFRDFEIKHHIVEESYKESLKRTFEYLCDPRTISKVICVIDTGLTPLDAICTDIENMVDCSEHYIRQMIDNEIDFIIKLFGYERVTCGKRQYLQQFSKGKHFETGEVYQRIGNGIYSIDVSIG